MDGGDVIQISENEKDNRCFAKAKQRGQRTFTLVAQDKSSPRTIAFWILENIETCPAAKLHEALDDAIVMRYQPGRKAAD
jgi:hypothetical protein